jgi:hypothetical protein
MLYFDTSYLLKCYIAEDGYDNVRDLAREGGIIACCTYVRMELFTALHRKLREAEIT